MVSPPVLADPGRYRGPARAAPYALTRMTPTFALVDIAAEIERADATIATMTSGKLGVIAEQISQLQAKARVLLEKAHRDAALHRVRCSFEKKPGGVYHLYRTQVDHELWFSRLAPDEWVTPQPQTFEGSFRLELDMSFTRLDVPDEGGDTGSP